MGPAAVPALAGLLEEAPLGGVRDIVGMLCSIGTPEAIDGLVGELLSADLSRGRCIVEALRDHPGRATSAVLLACLGHGQAELQQEAAFALGQLQDPAVIGGLGRIARRWGPFKRHGAVRREAVRALSGFSHSAAADELANVALGRGLWLLQRDTDVRTAAVRALARHISPKAHEYLGLIARRCKGAVAAQATRLLDARAGTSARPSESAAMTRASSAAAGSDTTVASAERR
jgi:HEAT repeat protein